MGNDQTMHEIIWNIWLEQNNNANLQLMLKTKYFYFTLYSFVHIFICLCTFTYFFELVNLYFLQPLNEMYDYLFYSFCVW